MQPSPGGQDGEVLHGHRDLALGAVADTGRKVSQTLRSTSMRKVGNLASLKVSGRFMARKAKEKVPRVMEPRNPRTQ